VVQWVKDLALSLLSDMAWVGSLPQELLHAAGMLPPTHTKQTNKQNETKQNLYDEKKL